MCRPLFTPIFIRLSPSKWNPDVCIQKLPLLFPETPVRQLQLPPIPGYMRKLLLFSAFIYGGQQLQNPVKWPKLHPLTSTLKMKWELTNHPTSIEMHNRLHWSLEQKAKQHKLRWAWVTYSMECFVDHTKTISHYHLLTCKSHVATVHVGTVSATAWMDHMLPHVMPVHHQAHSGPEAVQNVRIGRTYLLKQVVSSTFAPLLHREDQQGKKKKLKFSQHCQLISSMLVWQHLLLTSQSMATSDIKTKAKSKSAYPVFRTSYSFTYLLNHRYSFLNKYIYIYISV